MNRLATKDNLIKRGLPMPSDACLMCHSTAENLDHVMVCCSSSKIIGAYLAAWVDWWPATELTFCGLWSRICSMEGSSTSQVIRKTIGAAYFWSVWAHRNNLVFKRCCKKDTEIFREIQYVAYDWIRCWVKGGKALSWESWACNPIDAVLSCIHLAPR